MIQHLWMDQAAEVRVPQWQRRGFAADGGVVQYVVTGEREERAGEREGAQASPRSLPLVNREGGNADARQLKARLRPRSFRPFQIYYQK